MAHLKALSGLGVTTNPSYLGEWPLKIGMYMLNFGAIELLSFHYLNSLEATRDDFDKNLTRLLGARIDRIVELTRLSAVLSPVQKQTIEDAWLEAKKLSKWRNRIAHNPAVPTWKPGSDSENDPPDLIGIP